MNLLFVCFCLYILLGPFYIFPSGLPQPSDIILFLGGCYYITKASFRGLFSLKVVKILFFFLFIVFFVNFIYFYKGLFFKEDIEFLKPIMFYLFNVFVFLFTLYLFRYSTDKQKKLILYFILFSLAFQCLLGALGVSKGLSEDGGRAVIFFNNPNQLGYYALLIFSVFILLSKAFFKYNILTGLIFLMVFYLIILSNSRAAFVGVLFFILYIIVELKFSPQRIISIAILFTSLLFIFVLVNKDMIEKAVVVYEMRQLRDENREYSESENRGYDRILKYSEYLFYGAGEGAFYRFTNSHHKGEIHSGFATLLFSYGILGFITFMIFIYNIIKYNFWKDILFLLPFIIYNMTHQGLRQSLLWIVFALLYLNNIEKKYEKVSFNSYNYDSHITR